MAQVLSTILKLLSYAQTAPSYGGLASLQWNPDML